MKKISCTFFNSIAWRSLALGILMLCAGGLSAQDQVCATATGYDTIHNIVNPTVNRTVTVAGIPAGQIVEQVSVEFAIRHTWAGDLQLELTAPNGVTVFLGNNSTSCDLSKNGPITFYDGAPNNWNVTSCVGGFICLNNGQCEFAPAQPMVNTFNFQNGEQANGDWNFYVADMVGGDHGGLYDVTVCVDYAVAPTCDVTCPSDITINLDPGACCAQYTYSPILDGTDPLCVLVPEPVDCFTEQFAYDAITYGQNITGWTACDLIPGFTGCTVCEVETDECTLTMYSGDFGTPYCDGGVVFFGTMYQWEVQNTGTLNFDWVYSTDDSSPFWDPFGYSLGVDWSTTVATVGNLLANTNLLIDAGFGDPTDQNGTAQIDLFAGDIFALIVFTRDAFGGEAQVDFSNVFFGEAGATLTINEGPAPGEDFCIGDTDVDFDVNLANGEVVNCQFTVTVIEYSTPTTTLACNDNVQISLGAECDAFVSTDMILEGGPYSCYDDYLVAVEGYGEGFGGVFIDGGAVNEVLTVTVTDTTTGNSCWGTITVEDKLPPMIVCDTITLPCGVDTDPALTPPAQGAVDCQQFPDLPMDNSNPVQFIECYIDAPLGYAVTDVNLYVDITHTWSDDIDVAVIAPDGSEVTVASGVCSLQDNWDVLFDDESPNAFGCNPTPPPALSGEMQPQNALSGLDGAGAAGTWTVRIRDLTPIVDNGTINEVRLFVTYEELQATLPEVSDNCSIADLSYEDEEVGDDCDGFMIERTWTVTDGSGNTASCVQIINIEPLDLGLVQCPETYFGGCDDSIDPSNTGYVTVAGVPLVDGYVCNIFTDYWDKPLPACGNGSKIVRTWTILDWCTLETTECVQIIKLDAEGPSLTCPPDQTVGADPWNCYADVILVAPDVNELCGGANYTLTPSASNGTLVQFGPYWRVDDIPLGQTVITWTAEDDCDNVSTCSYTITVIDNVPPVPLCDEHTIVSLTTDLIEQGLTKVPATTFDDGSYDNCSPVTFTARRMASCIDFDWTTGGACIDDIPNGLVTSTDRGTAFRPCVPFACCDVAAGPIMVELRVEDAAGNVNSCMVEIEVQDKLSPFIVAPPNIVVSCDFWFDAAETNGFVDQELDVLTPVFGRVLDAYDYLPSDRQDIIIDDPGNDELPQPYNWGKEGWADDNCDVDITVRVRIFDDCSGDDLPPGAPSPYTVRLIERTFLARDGQGNTQTATQRIWVVDFDPFYISDTDCTNKDRNDGVIWPCDELYDFCPQGGLPVNYPTIFDDNCSLIGVTYDDTRFDFVDGACYKILRKWTVIDWCQYDAQEGTGIWYYTQVIKVIDDEPTFILGCYPEPITRSVLDRGITLPANNQVFLGENNPLSTSCSVHVSDTLRGSEFCSTEITYDVKIYPFNGSEFLQIHNKKTVPVDTNGFVDLILDTKTSNILAVRLNGLPYNDRYCNPVVGGEKDYHRVLWTVEDGCGNVNTCSYLMRLEDRKAPSPVCVGLWTTVMPSSGEVTIWASDFNASSFDDCTPAADLLYSFSGTSYEPSRNFTCDDLEANGGPQFPIEIWVADEGNDDNCNGIITWDERNKDYCGTFIYINDNENACGDGGSFGGVIETEELESVELVEVSLLNGDGDVMQTFTTDKDGLYNFFNPFINYTVEPVRNDDPTNGVTTLDLVNIQKHLLGIEALGSPYKLIAADANNSESVSAIDLVELRKLILGLYTELPNNKSWRFVDGEFEFADETNPWPFDEVIDISSLTMGNDFVGVKVGDVNGNVVANANQVETRNAKGVLTLETADQTVVAGEEVTVAVNAADFNNILGYQFTLRTEGLTLTGVDAGAIDMTAENVGVHSSSVTASWFRIEPVSVNATDVLFTMTFTATQAGKLSDMLSITSRITDAEAYNGSEELLDVALNFRSGVQTAGKDFALFQNAPNPFSNETVVSFTLPEAMSATLTVFDVTGKVVYTLDGDYAAGYNEVTLKKNQLTATGVLYYRLDADDFTATKKMVIIN